MKNDKRLKKKLVEELSNETAKDIVEKHIQMCFPTDGNPKKFVRITEKDILRWHPLFATKVITKQHKDTTTISPSLHYMDKETKEQFSPIYALIEKIKASDHTEIFGLWLEDLVSDCRRKEIGMKYNDIQTTDDLMVAFINRIDVKGDEYSEPDIILYDSSVEKYAFFDKDKNTCKVIVPRILNGDIVTEEPDKRIYDITEGVFVKRSLWETFTDTTSKLCVTGKPFYDVFYFHKD